MSSRAKGPVDADISAVRHQLQRILESPSFRTSRRCSAFLRYVVEGICEGRADTLKERTLGIAVFEREPSYDTNQDPVVRNTAGDVRKRLAQYYCEPGRDQEIRIVLPPGSYAPDIQVPAAPVAPEPVEAAPLPHPAAVPVRWLLIAGALLLIVVCTGYGLLRTRKTELDRFWSPATNQTGPLILCVGQPHVYRLNPTLDQYFEGNTQAQQKNPPPNATVPLTDITPTFNRYVSLGDVQTLTSLAAMAAHYDKDVEIRGDRTTSLTDLRGRPAVLIGAFNNQWTRTLTGDLRFFFDQDRDQNVYFVSDRQHPGQRLWQVRSDLPSDRVPMDYSIVSRVFSTTTEQAIFVAAGINRAGTHAAGEFLTSGAYLAEALRQAPPDWERKNMQVVLATKLYAGNPGPPTVVAVHFW